MVLSRFRLMFGFTFAAVVGLALGVAAAASQFVREVLAVAFPAADPRDLVRFRPAMSPPVLGRAAALSFRDSFLSRQGDGRRRSPLSCAFVT